MKPELVQHVSMLGMRQLTDATSGLLRKTIWLCVIVAGLGFSTFNIVKQIQLYQSKPVNVDFDVKFVDNLPFPTVTICNTNYIKKTLTDSLGLTEVVKQTFVYDFMEEEGASTMDKNLTAYVEFMQQSRQLPNAQHTVHDSVFACQMNEEVCGPENFVDRPTELGSCFSFNSKGNLSMTSGGKLHGLRLILNAHAEEFTRSQSYTEGPGFVISIHSRDVPPLMLDTGVFIHPGAKYLFGLQIMETTAPEGLDNCGTRSLNYYPAGYSRESCRMECVTDFMFSKCSCRDYSMPGNAPLCTIEQYYVCEKPAYNEYVKIKGECEANCPQTCSNTRFDFTTKSSLVVPDKYLTELAQQTNKTLDYWRKNYVSLEVFLTSMSKTVMNKSYSHSVLALFCDIGGALGLVIGASIVTSIEFLDYIFFAILAMFKHSSSMVHVKQQDSVQ